MKLILFLVASLFFLQSSSQIVRTNKFYTPLSGGSSPLLTDLVSYWKLDESSGTAADSKGSNTGTVAGTVTQGSSGKINTAYTFSGFSDTWLDCGSDASLRMTSAGTISAWVYQTTSDNYSTVVGNDDFDTDRHGYNFFIRLDGTVSLELASASAAQSVTSTTAISNNVWNHIVATWDGTNVHIYVNGNDEGAVSQTVTPTTNTSSFKIGNASIGSYNYTGRIDEVGVWSRALTGAEVTTLYNSGGGKTYPFN